MAHKTTFNLKFYCRESKKKRDGQAPLEMSINHCGSRVFLNLPFSAEPSKFNSKRRPKEYDDIIANYRTRVNQILNDMLANAEPITAERIKEYVQQGGYKSFTVEDMFDDYLNLVSNKDLAYGVYRKYELVKELYLGDYDGKKEVSAVTTATVSAFQAKLYKMYESSTAAGYMTKLKTMVKYAIDNGHLTVNPFAGIKITKERKDITFLTEDELKKLEAMTFENDSLENVRDLFLFQAASGLSYADICKLKPEDIQDDGDGHKYIHKRRVKTGTEFTAVILPMGIRILERHQGQPMRVISNQKYNAYLKVVQDLSGLDKRLHTHLARHSYCTTLINRGIRLEVIKGCAGHKSVKITEAFYAKLTKSSIVGEVSKAFD